MNCPRCGRPLCPGENTCGSCGLIFINSADNNGANMNVGIQNNNISNQQMNSINQVDSNNLNNTIQESTTVQNQNNGIINNQQVDMQNGNINNTQPIDNEPVNLEGYFIGKNYHKIKKRKFSWNTLIFGFGYTLYRRMLLISLIWIAIDIASVLIMGKYGFIVILALNVIMSFLINYIYLALVGNKVDNIKRKYWGHSIDELIYRCSQKGGTSTLPVFFLGFGGVVAAIAGFMLYLAFYPQYYVGELYFRVPSDFSNSSSIENVSATYEWGDNINFCGVLANKIENYESMDSYIEDYIDSKIQNYSSYDESIIERETVSIWGRDWKFINIPNDTGNFYSYFAEDSGILYNYQFNIYNGFGQECEKYHNMVKDSITIRNGK